MYTLHNFPWDLLLYFLLQTCICTHPLIHRLKATIVFSIFKYQCVCTHDINGAVLPLGTTTLYTFVTCVHPSSHQKAAFCYLRRAFAEFTCLFYLFLSCLTKSWRQFTVCLSIFSHVTMENKKTSPGSSSQNDLPCCIQLFKHCEAVASGGGF